VGQLHRNTDAHSANSGKGARSCRTVVLCSSTALRPNRRPLRRGCSADRDSCRHGTLEFCGELFRNPRLPSLLTDWEAGSDASSVPVSIGWVDRRSVPAPRCAHSRPQPFSPSIHLKSRGRRLSKKDRLALKAEAAPWPFRLKGTAYGSRTSGAIGSRRRRQSLRGAYEALPALCPSARRCRSSRLRAEDVAQKAFFRRGPRWRG
jgi:hypothetical protein